MLDLIELVAGIVLMTYASDKVVVHGKRVAAAFRINPFLIGLTLISLGTDLPEIANSITASYMGHGDINVGDSIGSSLTQLTLIMGILAMVSRPIKITRREVASSGSLLIMALFFFLVM